MSMKERLFSAVGICAGLFIGTMAQARTSSGVLFTGNVYMYNTTEEHTPGSKVDTKSSIYDLKLGYLNGDGLYLGGLYTLRNHDSGSTSEDGKALGLSLGYIGANSFFIKGHYIVSADKGNYKEGSGYQVDLGYITNITGSFLVGVELTYRSIEYKKNDSISGFDKMKKEELFPMLTVGLLF
ncbi:MAG: hypothetical protein AAGB31_00800 [Bdellovibrio sp.]